MSNRNSDGTYILPDEKVSRVWQNRLGATITRDMSDNLWIEYAGGSRIHADRIVPGHWLPWTPPTFPVRKKCDVRLCLIRVGGAVRQAAWFNGEQAPFRITNPVVWYEPGVSVVCWLTPEYEDELPGMENMNNGVQSSKRTQSTAHVST